MIANIKRRLYIEYLNNYQYQLFNTYLFGWESDFFVMRSMSKYCYEFEIKLSRSDFKADFKKERSTGGNKHEYLLSNETYKPNKFFFVCPDELIQPHEINEKYGLIWVNEKRLVVIRDAKFLHKENHLNNIKFVTSLMNKFYWNCNKLRDEIKLREWDLNYNQQRHL